MDLSDLYGSLYDTPARALKRQRKSVQSARNNVDAAHVRLTHEEQLLHNMEGRAMDRACAEARRAALELGLSASCADDVADELRVDIANRLTDQGL